MTQFYSGLDIVQCKEQFPSLDINYCQFLPLGNTQYVLEVCIFPANELFLYTPWETPFSLRDRRRGATLQEGDDGTVAVISFLSTWTWVWGELYGEGNSTTAQPRELGDKVKAGVKRTAHIFCKFLNVLNPLANTCLALGQANAGLMISQLGINMWLLG